jgi:riboflavin transporter FmnP
MSKLSLFQKIKEKLSSNENRRWDTKKLTVLAMLTALAFIVALVRIPTGLFILRYEAKDVIIAIGGFIYGPSAVIAMSVVLSFIEMMTVSDTGFFGLLMNIISTCTFAGTAAFVYKKWRTITGAAVGLVAGILVNVPVMLLWNYLIVPLFTPAVSREIVLTMLVPVFLPFNLIKGILNAAMIMMLYKPIRTALDKARILPLSDNPAQATAKMNTGVLVVSIFAVVTCVLFILSWRGIL